MIQIQGPSGQNAGLMVYRSEFNGIIKTIYWYGLNTLLRVLTLTSTLCNMSILVNKSS